MEILPVTCSPLVGDLIFPYTIFHGVRIFSLPRVIMSENIAAGRKVLVFLLGHSRPLDLPGGEISTAEIKRSVREVFADVLQLHPVADFFLQLKDAEWGKFVDLVAGQKIPDQAVLRGQVVEQVGWCM